MGNYISCTLSSTPTATSATKVILPNGELRQVSTPHTTAADLMLDFPGHFLVNSQSLHLSRRFLALVADEDLEIGNVYVMFPMDRVNSLVNAADMGRLLVAAGNAVRRASGGRARILPAAAPEPVAPPAEPRLKVEELDGELRSRLSLCRSRRPTLETITEESTVSSY